MDPILVPIVGAIMSLGVLPAIVFGWLYLRKRLRIQERDMELRARELDIAEMRMKYELQEQERRLLDDIVK